jgi:hypothetical protein
LRDDQVVSGRREALFLWRALDIELLVNDERKVAKLSSAEPRNAADTSVSTYSVWRGGNCGNTTDVVPPVPAWL